MALHRGPSRMQLNVVELSERSAKDSFKKIIFAKLGDKINDTVVLGEDVLCATYVKPRKTAGGIIVPDSSVDEDRWQGKANLVIKIGEGAFKFDGNYAYTGSVAKPGDYVIAHTSDTRELGLWGISCRTINWRLIKMIVSEDEVEAIY